MEGTPKLLTEEEERTLMLGVLRSIRGKEAPGNRAQAVVNEMTRMTPKQREAFMRVLLHEQSQIDEILSTWMRIKNAVRRIMGQPELKGKLNTAFWEELVRNMQAENPDLALEVSNCKLKLVISADSR
ncbi:MAG: hypothetical protein WC897_00460 [Candidatus Gracilibacteria bacterium]